MTVRCIFWPLSSQPRAQPIGQEAQSHMVDNPVRPPMIHRSHLQVAFEFAESLLDIQQPLVMTQHFGARTPLNRFVSVQQKPPILMSFLSDDWLLALPL